MSFNSRGRNTPTIKIIIMKKLITVIILISLVLTSVVYAQDTSISLTGRVYKRNVNEFSSASRENNNNLVNTKLGKEYKGKQKS